MAPPASKPAGGLLDSIGIDLAKMAVPEVVAAAKAVGKIAAAGITAAQLKGIADESPTFVQAVKNGDTQKALELGTNMLLQGGVAAFDVKSVLKDTLSTAADAGATTGDQVTGSTRPRSRKTPSRPARSTNSLRKFYRSQCPSKITMSDAARQRTKKMTPSAA
jgi:hypothetical protein